jgi:hypothetical protein
MAVGDIEFLAKILEPCISCVGFNLYYRLLGVS